MADFLIVEPDQMLSATKITGGLECTRLSVFSKTINPITGKDINYPLVLGNIVHFIFQEILEKMDMRPEAIQKIT
jgi:hypothetical protein